MGARIGSGAGDLERLWNGHAHLPSAALRICETRAATLLGTNRGGNAPFARDLGHVDAAGDVLPPFPWDENRRLTLRAKLDALYFILYGVFDPANPEASRDDIRYIYSTFPIVEAQEAAKWGRYRTRDLALAWINALMAGQPDTTVEG